MEFGDHSFFSEAPAIIYATTPIDIQQEVDQVNDETEEHDTDVWFFSDSVDTTRDNYVNFETECENDFPIAYIRLERARDYGMRIDEDVRGSLGLSDLFAELGTPAVTAPAPQPTNTVMVERLKSHISQLKTIYQDFKEFVVVEPLQQAINALFDDQEIFQPFYPLPKLHALTEEALDKLLSFGPQSQLLSSAYDRELMSKFGWAGTGQGASFWGKEHNALMQGLRLSPLAHQILTSWQNQIKAQTST